jgi:hypothetical protein
MRKTASLDLLLALFILSLLFQPLVEPDFGWHLRTGLDLVRNGWRMPLTDPYSHTMPDWPWVEHAWLADGGLALLYQGLGAFGALGVIACFAAVAGAAFLLAGATNRAGRTCRLLALGIVLWVALPFLGARTQMITLLGLAVVCRLWERYRRGARAALLPLPGLFLVWANLHGGFAAGLFILGLLLAGSAALRPLGSRWPALVREETLLSWPQIGHLAVLVACSALVTLINPYGWRLHQEIFASLGDRFMIETLHEWQPVSLASRAGRWYMAYLVLLGLGAVGFYRRWEPLRWTILAAFLFLSLRHLRNVPFFLLVSSSLCAELLQGVAGKATSVVGGGLQAAKAWSLSGAFALALGLVVLGPDHWQAVVRCGLDPAGYFRGTEYPIEAMEWVRAHRERVGTRLYNDYGLGGFLLWWLPDDKIFIDGRMPAWRIGNRWIFYDYVALTAWDPPELGVLAKYGVDWAIVGAGTPLATALAARTDWGEAYRDAKVALFVKKGEEGPGSGVESLRVIPSDAEKIP